MDKYLKTRRCLQFRCFAVYGISTSKITPYHLMCNGLLERIDTTMINVLITIPDNFKANSKDRLAKLTFACNSTVSKSTGFTGLYLKRIRNINIGENILLRHTKGKEGTRKLKCYWENKVYFVLEKLPDLPIYVTKPIEEQLNSAKRVSHKQHYELQLSDYRNIT